MEHHRCVVWIPSNSGRHVQPASSDVKWISIAPNERILAPNLSQSKHSGGNARLLSFESGRDRIALYYGGLMDATMPAIQNEMARHVTDGNQFAVLSADNFADNCVEQARRLSRTDITGNIAMMRVRRRGLAREKYSGENVANITMAATLVGNLQQEISGELIPSGDLSLGLYRDGMRGSILLIRPAIRGEHQQVCVMFGKKSWRQRRSMFLACVRITLAVGETIQPPYRSVSCTCPSFRLEESCAHYDAIVNDEQNKMRYSSLFIRREGEMIIENQDSGGWSAVKLPSFDKDNVEAWHAFRRRGLSSTFRTSASVLFDIRAQSLHRRPELRVQCMLCLGSATNRASCVHEETVIRFIKMRDERTEANRGMENALGPHEVDDIGENDHVPLQDDDEAYELLEDFLAADDGENNHGETRVVSYISSIPRPFFPCISDDKSITRVLLEIIAKKNSPEGGLFVGIDKNRTCKTCATEVYVPNNIARVIRRVSLHTLHHGSIDIFVTDFKCEHCGFLNAYDGFWDGIFSVSRDHAFTRELLDSWLWDVCNTGGTFRDAFTSWATKMWMPTAALQRVNKEPSVDRQLGNEGFAAFLLTLKFPKDEDMHDLFSCNTCERILPTGEKRLDGVVMDGSAVGILGKLPPFQRNICVVPSVRGVPDHQYIMKDAKSRKYIDAIMASAKKSRNNTIFRVNLKEGEWRVRHSLESKFFHDFGDETCEHYVVSRLVSEVFELQEANASNPDCSEEMSCSDEDSRTAYTQGFSLRHRSPELEIRRTLLDFGRCFCTGSIAGGVLRNINAVAYAAKIQAALVKFANCAHRGTIAANIGGPICEECARHLDRTATRADEYVASASRLSLALADAAMYSHHTSIRAIASCTADVLGRAIIVRARYFAMFTEKANENVVQYNTMHKGGFGLENESQQGWLLEAQATGEFFPGRPQIRPGLSFGDTGRRENSRECRKNYSKSRSHTPGIFTVQCVCRHPKLLGVSVMLAMEGVSTALSVLLSRFRPLPRVNYYDNACNMAKSIVLRVPWVNDECTIVCDRFHYKGHTCNSTWDPANHSSLAHHATSGAESINNLWTYSKSHLRYLRPDRLMPFIAARSVFINVRSMVREMKGKTDISSKEVLQLARQKWVCSCSRCLES